MSTRRAPVGRPFFRRPFLGLNRLSRRQRLILLVCGVQLPALVALAASGDLWRWLVLVPMGLTVSYLASFRGAFTVMPANRVHLYLGLWPFFAWWAACAMFLVIAPPFLVIGWLTGVRAAVACGVAAGISALMGLASVRRTPRLFERSLAFDQLPAALDG